MPTRVRHTKAEFLTLFESGELQPEIIKHLSDDGAAPEDMEQRSWNNSYAFMDIVLRGEEIPAEMEVICECKLPDRRRVDMVLLSPPSDSRCAIIVELKQWDRFFLENPGKVSEQARKKDPVAQAFGYQEDFEPLKEELGVERVLGCAYLHNIKEPDYRKHHKKPSATYDDVRVFFQGDTELFREFIRGAFEDDALLPTKAIKRAQEAGYWPEDLPGKAGQLREKLLSLGLVETVEKDGYDYRPTPKGVRLGIRTFNGFDPQKQKPFVTCSFTDTAMRNVAEVLQR